MNHFYSNRHTSEEGRQQTILFLDLEDACDEENRAAFEAMDKSHMKKGDINKFLSSSNVNHRDRKANRKRIETEPLHSLGRDRTWILC